MFGSAPAPDDAIKAQPSSVWVQYADSLLPVAAVCGAIGLLMLGLSLLTSQRMPNGTRGFALLDLGVAVVAVVAALVGLWWRWRQRG